MREVVLVVLETREESRHACFLDIRTKDDVLTGAEGSNGDREGVGVKDAIRIDEEKDFAASRGGADIASVSRSAAALILHDPGRMGFGDFRGTVDASVAYHDHLMVAIVRSRYGLQAQIERRLGIVSGNDDGDPRGLGMLVRAAGREVIHSGTLRKRCESLKPAFSI